MAPVARRPGVACGGALQHVPVCGLPDARRQGVLDQWRNERVDEGVRDAAVFAVSGRGWAATVYTVARRTSLSSGATGREVYSPRHQAGAAGHGPYPSLGVM